MELLAQFFTLSIWSLLAQVPTGIDVDADNTGKSFYEEPVFIIVSILVVIAAVLVVFIQSKKKK